MAGGVRSACGLPVDFRAGADLLVLLFGDDAVACELLVAGGVGLGVLGLSDVAGLVCLGLLEQRLVAGQVRLGLFQRLDVGARIDLEQQRVLGDVLPFCEVDRQDLPGHLRLHLHGR